MARRRRVLGSRHPATLDGLVSLGQALMCAGDHDAATRALEEGAEGSAAVRGEAHPATQRARRVLVENTERQRSPQPADVPGRGAAAGDVVELHGLASAAGRRMNGQLAVVVVAGEERCSVKLVARGDGRLKRVKRCNMRL